MDLTPRMKLHFVLWAFFGFCLLPAQVKASNRPNVLFILVDDLGYMDVGCNNPKTFYETPNIDALAASGMRFTDGYAANPVCSPTRYSIMTGKYPSRVDATDFFGANRSGKFRPAVLNHRMPLEEITIAELLKSAGYKTFFAGKWHLGPDENYWPTKQGFDINRGGLSLGGPYGGKQYFSPYGNPRLKDGPEGEHLTARLGQETSKFIRDHQDKPFLAYLAFYSVHTPLMAPQHLVEKYQNKAKRLGLDSVDAFADKEQVGEVRRSSRIRRLQSHATYAAMVESVDKAIGGVMQTLEETGLADNTLVFLTSDNGGLSTSEGSPTCNLPLRGGKGWVYEGGIREPFIIRAPGVSQPGETCNVPTMSIDFYPTIAELVGIEIPKGVAIDGLSLTGLLRGEETLQRDSLFWHYPHYSNQNGSPGGAIRSGNWKLIERYEDGRRHLYNLSVDIGERANRADQYPERVDEMTKKLHAWYDEVDAKFLRSKQNGPEPWRP